MRSHGARMSMVGLAIAMGVLSSQPPPLPRINVSEKPGRSPARLNKAEKKRERKAAQRAHLERCAQLKLGAK